jgi:hypothetical protein
MGDRFRQQGGRERTSAAEFRRRYCYIRECSTLEADTSLPSRRVTKALAQITEARGAPVAIRSDYGPKMSSRHFLGWCIQANRCHSRPARQAHTKRAHGKFSRPTVGVCQPEVSVPPQEVWNFPTIRKVFIRFGLLLSRIIRIRQVLAGGGLA